MKVLFTYLIAIVVTHSVYVPAGAFPLQSDPESEMYQKGLAAADEGSYAEAAQLWIQYAESLDQPEYRVGHDLIRLVTKHRLTEYYEKSSEIYQAGLNDLTMDEDEKKRLLDELFFVESMIDRRPERDLRRSIESNDAKAYRFFRDFWKEKTLTPSDEYNERLMEHWERVNFALENFNTTNSKLFDDRGSIYVRFGEPRRKRDGIFMYNPGFANYLVSTRMNDGGGGGGNSLENAINTTTYMNTLNRVVEYHRYPSFEVWVYYGLSNTPNNSVYLFGNDYGGAQMSLKQSVDDFIPSAAYSSGQRNSPVSISLLGNDASGGSTPSSTGGDRETEFDIIFESGGSSIGESERIAPALILQLMYYRQLASLDYFFSDRYEEMLDQYMNTTIPLSSSTARQFQQLNAARTLVTKRGVPDDKGSADNIIYTLNTNVYGYRFADEALNPYLRVYADEEMDQIITFEELKKRNDMQDVRFSDYRLMRTIRLFDLDRNQIEEKRYSSVVDTSRAEPLQQNVLQIPYPGGSTDLELVTELYDDSSGNPGEIAENSTVKKNLKGVGKSSVSVDEFTRSEEIFTSDIIVGHVNNKTDRFVISHDREIPENSILSIYFEAYNIPRDESGLYTFSLTYRLKRERSTLGRIIRFGRESYTTMTVENTTDSPVFDQTLEIVSDQLKSGDYSLELIFETNGNVTDPLTKSIPITVK